MKYCYACGRYTAGDPLFCNSCGCSYDVKLCPRLHPNPRHAEVCAQCGSREFSTPQPQVAIGKRLVRHLERTVIALSLTVLFLALVTAFLASKEGQNAFATFGILAVVLWWLWSLIPEWLKKRIHRRRKPPMKGRKD